MSSIMVVLVLLGYSLFILGPIAGAIAAAGFSSHSGTQVLDGGDCCRIVVRVLCLCHLLLDKSYQWVEFDGKHIRGRRFYTRRLVEHTIDEVVDVRVLRGWGQDAVTGVLNELFGEVRGYEIRFESGQSIWVMCDEMRNARELGEAIQKARTA